MWYLHQLRLEHIIAIEPLPRRYGLIRRRVEHSGAVDLVEGAAVCVLARGAVEGQSPPYDVPFLSVRYPFVLGGRGYIHDGIVRSEDVELIDLTVFVCLTRAGIARTRAGIIVRADADVGREPGEVGRMSFGPASMTVAVLAEFAEVGMAFAIDVNSRECGYVALGHISFQPIGAALA